MLDCCLLVLFSAAMSQAALCVSPFSRFFCRCYSISNCKSCKFCTKTIITIFTFLHTQPKSLRWKSPACIKERENIFSCIGTEHLRHQFIHLFDNISEGDIKGFVFQHNLLVQLSIFLIAFFVRTYRLSSHARLEAFVIQTKL